MERVVHAFERQGACHVVPSTTVQAVWRLVDAWVGKVIAWVRVHTRRVVQHVRRPHCWALCVGENDFLSERKMMNEKREREREKDDE